MGRLEAGVAFNEAVAQEAVLRYQQTIQQAVREVSDSLIEIRKRREFREQQELLTKTLSDASQIAKVRYEGGVSSYLEVLDTERQYFDAELQLAQAQRDEYVGVVQLYRALGGGWQAEDASAPPPAGGRAAAATPERTAIGTRDGRPTLRNPLHKVGEPMPHKLMRDTGTA